MERLGAAPIFSAHKNLTVPDRTNILPNFRTNQRSAVLSLSTATSNGLNTTMNEHPRIQILLRDGINLRQPHSSTYRVRYRTPRRELRYGPVWNDLMVNNLKRGGLGYKPDITTPPTPPNSPVPPPEPSPPSSPSSSLVVNLSVASDASPPPSPPLSSSSSSLDVEPPSSPHYDPGADLPVALVESLSCPALTEAGSSGDSSSADELTPSISDFDDLQTPVSPRASAPTTTSDEVIRNVSSNDASSSIGSTAPSPLRRAANQVANLTAHRRQPPPPPPPRNPARSARSRVSLPRRVTSSDRQPPPVPPRNPARLAMTAPTSEHVQAYRVEPQHVALVMVTQPFNFSRESQRQRNHAEVVETSPNLRPVQEVHDESDEADPAMATSASNSDERLQAMSDMLEEAGTALQWARYVVSLILSFHPTVGEVRSGRPVFVYRDPGLHVASSATIEYFSDTEPAQHQDPAAIVPEVNENEQSTALSNEQSRTARDDSAEDSTK